MKRIKFLMAIVMLTIVFGIGGKKVIANAAVEVPEDVEVKRVVVNELDYLNALLNATDEELRELGMTETEIMELRTHDYNADLMRLTNADEDALEGMGYNKRQIKKIKAYDGHEDAVSYATTYGLSSAELEGAFWAIPLNEYNSAKIQYIFRWNHCPIFAIDDSIAIGWIGNDRESHVAVLKVVEEQHIVNCHHELTDEFLFSKSPSVEGTNAYKVIEFAMQSSQDAAEYYSKSMEGYIVVEIAGEKDDLYGISVTAAYAHTVVQVTSVGLSVSVSDVGVSVSFGFGRQKLFYETKYFPAYGELA